METEAVIWIAGMALIVACFGICVYRFILVRREENHDYRISWSEHSYSGTILDGCKCSQCKLKRHMCGESEQYRKSQGFLELCKKRI